MRDVRLAAGHVSEASRSPHRRRCSMPRSRGTGAFAETTSPAIRDTAQNAPQYRMPTGLPVRSYLAVPVKARSGEVLGGLFFGHSAAWRVRRRHERLAVGVASWAAVALENARLYTEVAAGQPAEGRVPRHAVARAADAAQRHPRLRAHAARRRRCRRRVDCRGGRDDRAQRDGADPDRRRRAGRLADHLRQAAAERAAGGSARVVDARRRCGRAGGRRQGRPTGKHRGPAGRADLGRSRRLQQVVWNLLSNAVKFTPSGGRSRCGSSASSSHVEIVVSRHRHRHLAGVPAARLRAVPAGGREHHARARRAGPRSGDRAAARRDARRHDRCGERRRRAGATFRVRLPLMVGRPRPRRPRGHFPRPGRPAAATGAAAT